MRFALPLRGGSQSFAARFLRGKPRTKTVISATRRKQVFYTEERFADKPNLRPSGWFYPLRSTAWRISLAPLALRSEISIVYCACFAAHKSQNRLFCKFYSSLRSHKRAVLASLAQRSKPLFFVRLARASARIKTLGAKASYFFRVLCSEVLLFLECFIYIVRSCF